LQRNFIKHAFQDFKDGGWLGTFGGYFINMAGTQGDWNDGLFRNQLISPKTGNPQKTF